MNTMPATAEAKLQALLVRSLARLVLVEPDEALAIARSAVDHAPHNAALQFLYGSMLASKGRPEDALQHLQVAVASEDAQPIMRFQLALLQFFNGRLDEARESWRAIRNMEVASDISCYVGAMEALSEGRTDAALVNLGAGLGVPSSNPSLTEDMRLLKSSLESGRSEPSADVTQHVLLGQYFSNSEKQ